MSSVEEAEGRLGQIDMPTLRSQEKYYLQHRAAVGGKGADDEDSLQRGRWYAKNQARKKGGAGSGAGAGTLKGTAGGRVGKAKGKATGKTKGKRKGTPKTGYYRCSGPHFMQDCPLPYAKE